MAEEGLEGEEETKNNFETGIQEPTSDAGMGNIPTKCGGQTDGLQFGNTDPSVR